MYPQALLTHFNVLSNPEESLRTQVESIVSSYNSPWDILTELIQNAVDAIHDRRRSDSGFTSGKIHIEIDSQTGTITVEDNGSGIPPGKHIDMIIPGGSLKKLGNTYGHKGLGFTYCAHVCDQIEVETKQSGGIPERWTFNNAFNWLNDPTSAQPELMTGLTAGLRKFVDQGTAVKLKLAVGRYEANKANTAVLDKFFEWADDEKLIAFVLRTRTAVGQTFDLVQKKFPIAIDVEVALKNSGANFKVPYSFFDFDSYQPLSSSTYSKAVDYANNIYFSAAQHNKTHYGIYHVFDKDPSCSPQLLKVGKHKGGVRFAVYIYCCGKLNLSDALGQYDSRLESTHKYLAISTDVYLSIGGMPCGVPMDSWDNFGGFEKRYFAMVDVDLDFGKVLDAGRKTVTRHYVDLFTEKIDKLAKQDDTFGTYPNNASFFKLSQQLNNRTSSVPPLKVQEIISNWQNNPALPTKSMLFDHCPSDELGVYAVFAELFGRRFLPGWKALYVSSAATYDMAMSYTYDYTDVSFGNSTAGGNCLLGPGAIARSKFPVKGTSWCDSTGARPFLVVECKVSAEELLKETQSAKSMKDINQIDVLICIDFDVTSIKNLNGAIHSVTPSAREFSGVTHMLHAGSKTIHVICLKEAVQLLVNAQKL